MPPKAGAKKGGDKKGSKDKKGSDRKKLDPNAPEVIYAKAAAKLNQEKQNLAVELAFEKDRHRMEMESSERLEGEVASLQGRLAKTTADSDDILTHKQREIKLKMDRVQALESDVKEMKEMLEEAHAEVSKLTEEHELNRRKLGDAQALMADKNTLEDVVRQQDLVITKQEDEIGRLRKVITEKDEITQRDRIEVEELKLQASIVTRLRIVFGDPWLLTRTRHRLRGEVPGDREENSLCSMGSKLLVLFGGQLHGETTPNLSTVNLETFMWDTSLAENFKKEPLRQRAGHFACAMSKNKMVVTGGRVPGEMSFLPGDVSILNTDTMKWVQTPASKGQGPSRIYHTSVTVRERLYVFGGCGESYLNDLMYFDLEVFQWVTLNPTGILPSGRRGHTLCASEDGNKLWLFGGFDGQKHLNDLWAYEVEKNSWTIPIVTGMPPAPREMHAAHLMNKYLFVAGGQDAARNFNDILILNVEKMEWEVLEEGSEDGGAGGMEGQHVGGGNMEGSSPSQQQPPGGSRAIRSIFHGNRLLTLKPNPNRKVGGGGVEVPPGGGGALAAAAAAGGQQGGEPALDELEMLTIGIPDYIEELWRLKTASDDVQDILEITNDALTFPNAIEVNWRAPSKLADRIDRYKLMMANSTGVVKEVCQGKYHSFRVTGLRANTQYIFCVKAIYDDGSHLWSESKAFCTRFGGVQQN